MIGGLSYEDIVILVGILIGLVIFLFFVLFILCCLCLFFCCLCCGGGVVGSKYKKIVGVIGVVKMWEMEIVR